MLGLVFYRQSKVLRALRLTFLVLRFEYRLFLIKAVFLGEEC